ncbi:sulfatase-like hydrolase/transferase, partial [bacterium]|nr:sulfatase-like hydrolase/transferase [bacterium]
MPRQRSRRTRVTTRMLAPVLLGLLPLLPMLLLTSCGGGPDRPNVVLIVMDTLRADHLGCYGYERDVSPEIDAFAAGSTVYDRAYATAPWTVPTHGSLFTGKLPFRHGAHTYRSEERGIMVAPLPEVHVTLAEVFAAEGYRTGAFVANDAFLGERFQFDQGFATYHVEPVHADQLNRRAARWLREDRGAPFFMFMNFMDTHRV